MLFQLGIQVVCLQGGHKLNVHKTSRISSERLMYVQFTSSVYGLQICQISYYNISRKNPAMSPFLVWLQTPAYNDITNCKSLPIFLSFSISHLAQPWKLNDKNIEELLQIIISDFKLFYRGRLVHSVLRQGLLLKYAAGFFVCICVIVCICVMFAFISKTECTNLPRYYSTLLWRIYFLHKSFFSNDENLIKLQIYKENQFM